MNYKENYKSLINHAKKQNRKLGNGNYYEVHHILPRSLGGQDIEENLVLLTAREHYLAHYLLWKFTNGEEKTKMLHAFRLMSLVGDYYVFSSRAFERAKLDFQKIINKPVICLQTLEVFPSLRTAAFWIISQQEEKSKQLSIEKNLSSMLNSGRKSCYGYNFEFYDENKNYQKKEKCSNKQFSSKPVICLQTLKIYNSAREAEKDLNIDYRNISRSCINNISTHGYNFEFYDENKNYQKKEKQKKHRQQNLKIICEETGKEFKSLTEMEKVLGIPRSTISNYIKNSKAILGEHYKKVNYGE